MKGIAASSSSACTSGLRSITCIIGNRIASEIAHGSLRLTLGEENTEEDIDYVLEVLPEIVQRLRICLHYMKK